MGGAAAVDMGAKEVNSHIGESAPPVLYLVLNVPSSLRVLVGDLEREFWYYNGQTHLLMRNSAAVVTRYIHGNDSQIL